MKTRRVHSMAAILALLAAALFVFAGCGDAGGGPAGSGPPAQAAAPVADPAAGAVLTGAEITLTTATEGASIYYTLDGATPTASSTLYSDSGKPSVTADVTLKAIAIKDGMENSEVLTAAYTIGVRAAMPTASPPAGVVVPGMGIGLTTATDGASIHFTLDGTTPTPNSTLYSDSVKPSITAATATLKAIAVKDGMVVSDVLEAAYTNLAAYLGGLAANDAANPHTVAPSPVTIDASHNLVNGVWARINDTVASAGKYVILDLSGCSAANNTIAGVLSPSNSDMNIIWNNSYIKGIILPDSLTSIGASAFYGCTWLTSVTIPSGVTTIGNDAFSGCTGLTSVAIPSGVATIGAYAFSGCTGLTSVAIPDGVTSILESAFWNCTGLTSVTIPSTVTSIGTYAFRNCSGLGSVTIPSGVTTIGTYAFYNCTGLTDVTIPSSVTTIGTSAFSGCTELTSVTFESGSISSFGSFAFPGADDNLRDVYTSGGGGAGTYTRSAGGYYWTKQ